MVTVTPPVGEPLALDLLNTRLHAPSGPVDLIGTADGLRSWLGLEAKLHTSLAISEGAELTAVDLARVHAVRDHAATAIAAVRTRSVPPEDALRGLNIALAAAPPVRELAWQDGVLVCDERRWGGTGERIAATLAAAVADLMASPDVVKIRECAAQDCVLLFLPAHPRRQWCSAKRCGNRSRVARHYDRHKRHGVAAAQP
jgi:predicted RNA-binding Zn ribbon-like protein